MALSAMIDEYERFTYLAKLRTLASKGQILGVPIASVIKVSLCTLESLNTNCLKCKLALYTMVELSFLNPYMIVTLSGLVFFGVVNRYSPSHCIYSTCIKVPRRLFLVKGKKKSSS